MLALMAPAPTDGLRIEFARLPALRYLVLDGAAHPDLAATSSLLDGQSPQVSELGINLFNVEDGWGTLEAIKRDSEGSRKVERLNLKLDAIHDSLDFSRNISATERARREGLAYRLAQFLDNLLEASESGAFCLQPRVYRMNYENYLQAAHGAYDAPWGRYHD